MKELAFGRKFRKGSGTSKFVIFASVAVFGVLAIALLAPSSGFTNNPFSPYSTYTTTVSGSTYTITQQPTVTTTATVTGSSGTHIPITIVGNITGSQITSLSTTTTAVSSTNGGSSNSFAIVFTLTGQTGSHVQPTVCLPESSVPSGTAPRVVVNGGAPDSQSYTIVNGQVCVTFTTHFSTDTVAILFTSPITVTTDKTSYPAIGGTRITVSGNIAPALGISGTSATVAITNSHGLFVTNSTAVDPTTGAYSVTFVSLSNASSLWVSGVYTATVTWAASATSTAYQGTGTFGYGTTTSTTTTTTTSSSSSGTGSTIVSSTTITSTAVATSTVNTSTEITTTISGTVVTLTTSLPGVQSTTTTSGAMNTTVIAIGAAAVVIAIIAGALAAMALRKK